MLYTVAQRKEVCQVGWKLRRAIRQSVRRLAYAPRINAFITGATPRQRLVTTESYEGPDGTQHHRYANYRDVIVPRWPGMFENGGPFTVDVGSKRAASAGVDEMVAVVRAMNIDVKDALDVGCDVGYHAYALAKNGIARVHGIDIPEYGARQSVSLSEHEQSTRLRTRRDQVAEAYDLAPEKVSFQNLDICDLAASESFDLIYSWETLEHIQRPEEAMRRIYAALRPGGISFHEYNPFFAINGGHSLCTLDFDWAHVRLPSDDVPRYLMRYRPEEAEVAVRFFQESLNRLTISQAQDITVDCGFEIVALVPWSNRLDLGLVNGEILAQATENYPSCTLTDLISRNVWLVARRPLE